MVNDKDYLLHSYERLDIEYEVIRQMAESLRSEGKPYAADDLDEAKDYLYKAILCVKKSWKYLDPNPDCEQLIIDIPKP